MDTYVRFFDVARASNLGLSFPFTSTYEFAKNLGVPSLYYIPDLFVDLFRRSGKRDDCFYGMNALNKYISSLTGRFV